MNQWRNTASVIDWFKAINDKNRATFLKFDVKDFYPSISCELIKDSLSFARTYADISAEDEKIILHACNSLLFYKEGEWVKKEGEGTFDITMGSYHGAEACELVGLFILNKLTRILGRDNVGLYRDDGLAVLKRKSGPEVDRIRKKLHLTFKNHGLEITLETGLKMTDFLDITLDLRNNRFFPYRKPNNPPSYINKNSNHPPSIIKQIPTMINKRLCDLLSVDYVDFYFYACVFIHITLCT